MIVRESRYRANAMGRGGASGLMQIKLATARAMGYSGSAAGLLDPETNLTYGVKYLAGAYRTARGNHGRAVELLCERLLLRSEAATRDDECICGSFACSGPLNDDDRRKRCTHRDPA